MDQPTAEAMLRQLDKFVGEWTLEATPPGGPPWSGGGRAWYAWHDSGMFLIERSTVELPEAPDGTAIIGCDAANGTYTQLYSDERGVCRVYQMSLSGNTWKLWREGAPFAQRFTGTFSDDGNTITGRWEVMEEGKPWRTDFDLTFTRVTSGNA